jgi:hypothetical protein
VVGTTQIVSGIRLFGLTGVLLTASACTAAQASKTSLCNMDTLPKELRNRMKEEFSSWKVKEVSNLGPRAKARWESEKPLSCPGLAVGEFEKPNQLSYAVLLVPIKDPDSAYRLLIFTPGDGKAPSVFRKLDEWDKGGAGNYFIHRIRIAKVFSVKSVNKLRVKTRDGLLFCDSGENEYETDVLFSSQGKYRSEPIDY